MFKSVGVVLIIVSAAGLGFSKSREAAAGQRTLENILRLVILLKREICYKNSTLYDAFADASEKIPGEYGAFLKETAEEIRKRKGESFGVIFRKNAQKCMKMPGLSKEEQDQFFSLGEHLGYLDLDMQIRQLELYQREVEDSIEERKEKLPEKIRVYKSLGILFGILLAVLVC